ncbi:MAG: QacE, partial [Bacteroidetes bacterium HGW-Bacteroidetes-22]
MAEEKIFLEEGGIKVTNARFITHGKTHSMGGITSVSSYKIEPSKK